jgi:erythritol transport system ATP-binding protein
VSDMNEVVMRAEGVEKVFGRTVALTGVDFNVYRGRVNALVGENGAGKSTLMGILAGIHQPTRGQLTLNGESVRFGSPRDAADQSIRIIHQELQLFPDLSVAENIFVGAELTAPGGVRLREQERRAARLLARLDQSVSPSARMGDLPVGLQQIVVICRALVQDVEVLIMDEPTSALSSREVQMLLRIVRNLADEGVGIVYISHRLEEIMEVGDHVTVLRDGRLVAEALVSDIDVPWVVERMIGHEPESLFPYRPRDRGDAALRVTDLRLTRPDGSLFLDRISLACSAGEIVGLYGLMGAGRTELLEALIGLRPIVSGQIHVNGRPVHGRAVGQRIAQGLFLVPEDRQSQGLVQTMSVAENISLASLDGLRRGGALSPRRERRAVAEAIAQVGVKVGDPNQPVPSLSGGNQQKVVVARALLTRPKVLLMDDPMRGIDVGAKTELYGIMQSLARDGLAILFASSDLLEVLGMADRVLVLARGRLVREFDREEATAASLTAAANLSVTEELVA